MSSATWCPSAPWAPSPYYTDLGVALYHGDCREVLPRLGIQPDSAVCDPPYQETSSSWDVWPEGWVAAVGKVLPSSASLWCFGSARMFLDHRDDFTGWRFAQEALWVKRNGSGPTGRDRLVKVHEWAYQWYRGRWGDLTHSWERESYNGADKSVNRVSERDAVHQNVHKPSQYIDDGTRQPRSVTFVIEEPSVRYTKRHRSEKPERVVRALVQECTPLDGLVLDPMAGSGTVGVVAIQLGMRAVLIEADEKSCEIAARRLSELKVSA